jgi:beta-glucosidase
VPFVTLYHWDLPEALEESIGGWLNSEIVEIYGEFAQLCFQLFGDRVKHWITFNEIHSFAGGGYFSGKNAPGRCSAPYGNCTQGNSLTEPYIVAHNALNAHALAVNIYKTQFQDEQKGLIGITVDSPWYEPLTDSSQDREAAQFGIEDFIGWFLDPIFFGDYPASMRASLGNRLPHFTAKQSAAIKGSYDFIGLNHYSSEFATRNDSDGSIVITRMFSNSPNL